MNEKGKGKEEVVNEEGTGKEEEGLGLSKTGNG